MEERILMDEYGACIDRLMMLASKILDKRPKSGASPLEMKLATAVLSAVTVLIQSEPTGSLGLSANDCSKQNIGTLSRANIR